MKGYAILEDGTILEGKAFGDTRTIAAYIYFHTEMSGYEYIYTDPANSGQIIVMTYPLQGNYGFNAGDITMLGQGPKGVIMKDYSDDPSHYECECGIRQFFLDNNMFGLVYADTRMITKRIRGSIGLKCCLTTEQPSVDMIDTYFCPMPIADGSVTEVVRINGGDKRVAVLDLGSKHDVLKVLQEEGASITLFPHNTAAEEVLEDGPDDIIITHGSGDPRGIIRTINTVKELYGHANILGIGMGALVLGMAVGMDVALLPGNGYRGANYPVMCTKTGKILFTRQNIGYGLRTIARLPDGFRITHKSINDGGISGFGTDCCTGLLFLPERDTLVAWLDGNGGTGGLTNA